MHGKLFEDFIRHARTDRYHIMCSIIKHYNKKASYEDKEIIIGDIPILQNTTTEALEELVATLILFFVYTVSPKLLS